MSRHQRLEEADNKAFQYLIAGALMGALSKVETEASPFLIHVEPLFDGDDYLPAFIVTGAVSGTKLMVRVEVMEGES